MGIYLNKKNLKSIQSTSSVIKELQYLANPKRAELEYRFFKTGPGQYGEGDIFLGITVPDQRRVAYKYKNLPLTEIKTLLDSKIHNHRLTGLFILTSQFRLANDVEKQRIVRFYLENLKAVNNWDLVDTSAPQILGNWLVNESKDILYQFSDSENLWERRIAIIATFAFIRQNLYEDTLKIAKILLNDKQDLIHKAVGWMLREVGKKDLNILLEFLDMNYTKMPRTMLRYAIEKLDPDKRKYYLSKSR